MNALLTQWNGLPRAAKWLIALGLFVAGYFAVFTPVMNFRDSVVGRADKLESLLNREKDFASGDSGDGGYIHTTVSAFGLPKTPGDLKPETFTRVVNGILEGHGVMDHNNVERRVPLSGDSIAALGMGKVDRLILEVSFEADPAIVFDILAALENAKEVAAVGRIRIDRGNSRADDEQVVRATISPEAWIVAAGSSSSSTPSEVIP